MYRAYQIMIVFSNRIQRLDPLVQLLSLNDYNYALRDSENIGNVNTVHVYTEIKGDLPIIIQLLFLGLIVANLEILKRGQLIF